MSAETEEVPVGSPTNAGPLLDDPWYSGAAVALNGFAERHGFAPWFAALFVLVICFVVFQVGALIGLLVILAATGVDLLQLSADIQTGGTAALAAYPGELLFANALGLIFVFGVTAIVVARLSTRRVGPFLRLRSADVALVGLSVLGWVCLVPIVQYAAQLNAALPWPDWVVTWEQQMLEPIAAFLGRPDTLVASLLMIAVTPAICEELLFRGYIQRQFERSAGARWAIVLSGVLFGAYHLQPMKLAPLAILGVYLAFITWRSGSLIPAIIVHFLNNALAIVASNMYARSASKTVADLDAIVTPWYVALVAVGFLTGVVYLLNGRARTRLADLTSHQTSN